MGLILEGGGVAANVLKNLDLRLADVRLDIERLLKEGGREAPTNKRLPQTPKAKKVIEYAMREARGLGHNYVGTEHILLGL